MKPMTMMRLRFIVAASRFAGFELPHDMRIAGDDDICRHALRDDGSGGDDRVLADRDAFEQDGVHPDPDVVADDDRGGFNFGRGGRPS